MTERPGFDPDALRAAAAWPHPVGRIELRETNISLVVLTGDYAYKIKKSVQFDFIDTRSLQHRRELCEEEVRLNRRLAPDLYLGVVPIVREHGQLRFGGSGEPIEYAVRMRQFDPEDELLALLAAQRVSLPEVVDLAVLLANFHAGAERIGSDGRSIADSLCRTVRGNLAGVLQHADRIHAREQVLRLRQWTDEQVAAVREQLYQRERDGFVRDCHGDLHARNIVRWQGRLIPFDCLDFDPALRQIDVLNDLAFLFMDFNSHARPDLAFALLNRYLEATGDYAGTPLLAFYGVYRALVRAKIDLLEMQQRPAAQAEAAGERARARVRTASAIAAATRPVLAVMHGASGSGKSWLSERLVPVLPAVRIRSDIERKRLAGIEASRRHTGGIDQGIYTLEFNTRTYDRLLECAGHCLRAGLNTIVDAAFLQPGERHAFASLAQRSGARFCIVSCHADPATLAGRVAGRQRAGIDPSDANLAVLQRQLATMEALGPDEGPHVVQADTREAGIVDTVVARLRR